MLALPLVRHQPLDVTPGAHRSSCCALGDDAEVRHARRRVVVGHRRARRLAPFLEDEADVRKLAPGVQHRRTAAIPTRARQDRPGDLGLRRPGQVDAPGEHDDRIGEPQQRAEGRVRPALHAPLEDHAEATLRPELRIPPRRRRGEVEDAVGELDRGDGQDQQRPRGREPDEPRQDDHVGQDVGQPVHARAEHRALVVRCEPRDRRPSRAGSRPAAAPPSAADARSRWWRPPRDKGPRARSRSGWSGSTGSRRSG